MSGAGVLHVCRLKHVGTSSCPIYLRSFLLRRRWGIAPRRLFDKWLGTCPASGIDFFCVRPSLSAPNHKTCFAFSRAVLLISPAPFSNLLARGITCRGNSRDYWQPGTKDSGYAAFFSDEADFPTPARFVCLLSWI